MRHFRLFGPGGQLLAGRFQHPLPHFKNEAGVFKGGNEFGREDQSMFRVLPAQKRLNAGHLVNRQLCLVVEDKLLFMDRVAQIMLKRGAFQ